MTEYLVLLKLNPAKLVDTMDALRGLPKRPGPGVDLHYIMNVFGTWDVAMWFDAENPAKAVDFVQRKVGQTSGVVDIYTVPTFPNNKLQGRQEEHQKEKVAEETSAPEEE